MAWTAPRKFGLPEEFALRISHLRIFGQRVPIELAAFVWLFPLYIWPQLRFFHFWIFGEFWESQIPIEQSSGHLRSIPHYLLSHFQRWERFLKIYFMSQVLHKQDLNRQNKVVVPQKLSVMSNGVSGAWEVVKPQDRLGTFWNGVLWFCGFTFPQLGRGSNNAFSRKLHPTHQKNDKSQTMSASGEPPPPPLNG